MGHTLPVYAAGKFGVMQVARIFCRGGGRKKVYLCEPAHGVFPQRTKLRRRFKSASQGRSTGGIAHVALSAAICAGDQAPCFTCFHHVPWARSREWLFALHWFF